MSHNEDLRMLRCTGKSSKKQMGYISNNSPYKVFVYIASISFLIAATFYVADYEAGYNENTNLKEVVFYDVGFDVVKSTRGTEARVILYKGGNKVFTATCDGLNESVCTQGNFNKRTVAKYVMAFEAQPQRGALRSGEYVDAIGNSVEFVNYSADAYLKTTQDKAMNRVWFSALVGGVFLILSLLFKFICRKSEGGL